MPIYAYKCASCGFAKDVLQKISDAQLTECPSCGKPTFTKQLTAAGFQLKGSGWYVTDFKGGNTGAPASGGDASNAEPGKSSQPDSGAAKPADGKSEGKTEAKTTDAPAKKAESTPAPSTKTSE